jgi:protein transport protein SEC61 subunit gamma-like protein
MMQKLNSFIIECKRVLQVTKKPNAEEFKTIVKVSGLGILIIGALGFLLLVIKDSIF